MHRPIVAALALVIAAAGCGEKKVAEEPQAQVGRIRSLPVYEPYLVPYPFESGVEIGNGWDTAAQRKTAGKCVSASERTDDGAAQDLRYTRIVDTNSLAEALSFSAKARASNVMGGSVSASASYAESKKLENTKTYIAMTAKVRHGTRFLTHVEAQTGDKAEPGRGIRLTPEASALLAKSPDDFRRECGDGFVSSLTMGGAVFALYEFDTANMEERIAITAAMQGSFPSVKFSADMSKSAQRAFSSSKTKIEYSELGSKGGVFPVQPDELVTRVAELPARVAKEAAPFEIIVTPYTLIPDLGIEKTELDKFAEQSAVMYLRFKSLALAIDDITANPAQYEFLDPVTLDGVRTIRDQVEGAKTTYREAIGACTKKGECSIAPERRVTDYQFRAHLPPPKSYHPSLNETATLTEELKAAQTRLANANVRDCGPYPGDNISINDPFGGRIMIDNRADRFHECQAHQNDERAARAAASTSVDDTSTKLKAAQDRVPSDTRQLRYEFWLDEPAKTRCRLGEEEPCLYESTLSTYRLPILQGKM